MLQQQRQQKQQRARTAVTAVTGALSGAARHHSPGYHLPTIFYILRPQIPLPTPLHPPVPLTSAVPLSYEPPLKVC